MQHSHPQQHNTHIQHRPLLTHTRLAQTPATYSNIAASFFLYAATDVAALPRARLRPTIIVIALPFCTAIPIAALSSCDTILWWTRVLLSRDANTISSMICTAPSPKPPADSTTKGTNVAPCARAVASYLSSLRCSPTSAADNCRCAAPFM